jgi:hypothetical protein
MSFTPNDDGIRKLFDDIARKINAADKRFRTEWEGRPAAEVEPAARASFERIGVNLTDAQVTDYAAAVEAREPFKFRLQ